MPTQQITNEQILNSRAGCWIERHINRTKFLTKRMQSKKRCAIYSEKKRMCDRASYIAVGSGWLGSVGKKAFCFVNVVSIWAMTVLVIF